MENLSLRLRIALFFAALAIGVLALVILGLKLGYARHGGDPNGYVIAGLIAGFGSAGLIAGIWYLFDENVAKPINRLAADLRVHADAGVAGKLDEKTARYLGDLAPAAKALSNRLGDGTVMAAEHLAAETARLTAEREKLTAVLSDIPLAVIMVSPDHRILLYDGQAANALEPVRPLGLGQSVFGYLNAEEIHAALDGLAPQSSRELSLSTADGTRVLEGNLRRLGADAGYMLTLQCEPDAWSERPLAFDFDTLTAPAPAERRATPIRDLSFVIFDTETTGLLPEKDDVVQIGAVRAVGPRLIDGETFDTLVNPGRPIPATSTKVHGISDDMVANAPAMQVAGTRFLQFCDGAVLVAHNAPFDMAFLRRHAEETGTALDHPVLDTVLLGAELFGATDGLTLDALAERLAVEIPDVVRHTAIGDAYATAAVFLKMIRMFEARGLHTLGDLLDVQKAHVRILPDMNSN